MIDDLAPVAILCGGRGTRLQEHTREIPKALVEIGGRPILQHVIELYVAQGFSDFLLLTGYLGEQLEDFTASATWGPGVSVRCLHTGLETPTGGRLHAAREEIAGPFCCTYADGLADIDLGALLEFHRSHGGAATMTVAQPRSQFGIVRMDEGGRVDSFAEKPTLNEWVNGGFFRFEPAALDYLGPDAVLEREPLEGLAAAGELYAFRHGGFWDCMDTYKDAILLNELWASGHPPWVRAQQAPPSPR